MSRRVVLLAALTALAWAPAAAAQLPPLPVPLTPPGPPAFERPHGADDGGGFRDVLPSGTRGRYNAAELALFLATGRAVPHCCDQLAMTATWSTRRRA